MFTDIRDILNNSNDILENKVNNSKCPEVKIHLNDIPVIALVDTGSQVNGVSEQWYYDNEHKLGNVEILKVSNTYIKGALGHKSKLIKKQILLTLRVNNWKLDVVFLIIPGLSRDCVLGVGMLREGQCIIDMANNKMICKCECDDNNMSNIKEEMVDIFNIQQEHYPETQFDSTVSSIPTLNDGQRQQLIQILTENQEIFREQPGRIRTYEHVLRVTDDTPFCQRGWPVPLKYQDQVEQEIQQMLQYGVIERANSQYINPLVTIIKKDQSVRLCLDARKLNSVTIPDYEGAPPINEILANCGGMKVMSSIDLRSSFWQIPLKRECRDYTGFLYKGRTYRFTVTPFGLKTSLASLTRGLDSILTPEIKAFTIIYVDDILCFSSNISEHLKHLELLFKNLRNANITVNFTKSQLFRKEINYLGYCLSTEGISTSKEKVEAIQKFPRPRNPKQLKGFLGLTNFYNKFSNRYAEVTQPLLQLLKKGKTFRWTEENDRQFQLVKELFIDTVMLKHPNIHKRYYLQTDASDYALGGQLFQYDEDNNIGVIAFTSRTFKGAEIHYTTTEKELLSIIHCLKKFRIYLLGNQFTIVTDNKALTFLQKCHLGNARTTRWIMSLQEYDFQIVHCKGSENVVADILSRHPADLDECSTNHLQQELEINKIQMQISHEVRRDLKNISKKTKG